MGVAQRLYRPLGVSRHPGQRLGHQPHHDENQGGKRGQLREWLEDYDEVEPNHRHFSHLFALFPGDQITLEATPELARAARVSLEHRMKGYTGWGGSRSWAVALWARLGEGDMAEEQLRHLVSDYTTGSLLALCGNVIQLDGNFGGVIGVQCDYRRAW